MITRIKVFDLVFSIISLSVLIGICYNILNKSDKSFLSTEIDLVDWHDWNLIEQDKYRSGLGEHGEPAHLSFYPPYSKEISDIVGYNSYLSDKISLNRSLKDLRPPE